MHEAAPVRDRKVEPDISSRDVSRCNERPRVIAAEGFECLGIMVTFELVSHTRHLQAWKETVLIKSEHAMYHVPAFLLVTIAGRQH